mmetsp:Transcript_40343/g.58960  ORF Transcript_40343/g.58960 Transcript_40343/m.58960 type:complete len:322 (-) Transcript_40343:118-1083(-)
MSNNSSNNTMSKSNSRWGSSSQPPPSNTTSVPPKSSGVSEEDAIAALLSDAQKSKEAKVPPQKRHRDNDGGIRNNDNQSQRRRNNDNGGPAVVEDDVNDSRKRSRAKRSRWDANNDDNPSGNESWGKQQQQQDETESAEAATGPKQKANFGLSGALASDDKHGNVYNGVLLKFSEPPEARVPNTRWRFYVFRAKDTSIKKREEEEDDDEDGEPLEILHISKQSAYLFGREIRVADIPVHHPSLSKQHAVLQYRATPDARSGKLLCRPYIMDLASTNGTFLNGVRLEDARYYELRKGDVIRLGSSSREYVLLTENTTGVGGG